MEIKFKQVYDLDFSKLREYQESDGVGPQPTDVLQVIDIILKNELASQSSLVFLPIQGGAKTGFFDFLSPNI